jgi:osmoprotectant transport system permease protein
MKGSPRFTRLALALLLSVGAATALAQTAITTGSKAFTENVILGELLARLAADAGAVAEHKGQLGGTRILWNALQRGDIDAYVEYTGTLSQEILADSGATTEDEIRAALAAQGIVMTRPLGFNNTYALGMREDVAAERGIAAISDLRDHPDLDLGFTNEFMDRGDGWPALRDHYALPHKRVKGLDHDLAYRGIEQGAIAVTDLYSTDAEIRYYELRVLRDDLSLFPPYEAVVVYRSDLEDRAPEVAAAFRRLEGRVPEAEMIGMNARAKLARIPEGRIAADFLATTFQVDSVVVVDTWLQRLGRNTAAHLLLVLVALAAGIAIAVPTGILASRHEAAGQVALGVAGILQTVPALALLVLMIPLVGIKAPPAILALFLYSLLPMVRNTCDGIRSVPASIWESATALGLSSGARLRLVELPLAMPSILAGVKIAAVQLVGFATLGAFVGAGGYGQPILTGIRLDDFGLILEGALPAAGLALVTQGVFELAERGLVSKGLRLRPETG